jgi:GNAT superfamily N-acetyltransferase
MKQGYKEISYKNTPETGPVYTYEKVLDDFVLELELSREESAYIIDLKILKDEWHIGHIIAVYNPDKKILSIKDMYTRPEYRRKGLGRLRVKEVISFLASKGETPKTIIAESVGLFGNPDGVPFVKSLGFKQIENTSNWQISFEELNKRLNIL